MSYRTQVAEAIKAALVGKTSAEDRVFTKLDRPLTPAEMPAIVIYTMTTRRGAQDMSRAFTPRLMEVAIEAAVSGSEVTALDDATALADAIELAIEEDPELGFRVNDTRWQSTDVDTISAGERTIGVCLLEYQVDVYTNQILEVPGTPIDTVYVNPGVEPAPEYEPPVEGGVCGPDGCNLPAWGGERTKLPEADE